MNSDKMDKFDLDQLIKTAKEFGAEADWVGLRHVHQRTEFHAIRDDRPDENTIELEDGMMFEVLVDGQFGYAGTSDTSEEGIKRAFQKAKALAASGTHFSISPFSIEQRPMAKGRYSSPMKSTADRSSLGELSETLLQACQSMKVSDEVTSRLAAGHSVTSNSSFASSNGSEIEQNFSLQGLILRCAAERGSETQIRHDQDAYKQIGFEYYDRNEILERARKTAHESIELLDAEDCPNETTTVILDPAQMMLQIHESIGHPLEIDRILGDERNYAGWSFIREKDFGQLMYGSKLLNVSFDPTVEGEFASYAFDDTGLEAKKVYLIKDGLLIAGLGGAESQYRSGLSGTANARAQSWNRPPLDRMANINLEPGDMSFEQMIGDVERGIYMCTNRSWSIDDYRRKFQFGCEYAKLIENGKLTKTIKNPNYRSVTNKFWHNLTGVGNKSTFEVYGTPHCGKAEPNQVIRVGHGSPVCRFNNIEVFGGSQ